MFAKLAVNRYGVLFKQISALRRKLGGKLG
jgi:hypothetical protein